MEGAPRGLDRNNRSREPIEEADYFAGLIERIRAKGKSATRAELAQLKRLQQAMGENHQWAALREGRISSADEFI